MTERRTAKPRVGRPQGRFARWSAGKLPLLALLGAGGLAAAYGLARVWPSPPWLPVIVGVALLLFLIAGLSGILFGAALGARLSLALPLRVGIAAALGVGWLVLCDRVLSDSVGHWLFNQGSRDAVTTIRPAAGGGPVFDVYRVTDGRPLLAVRRGPWSELVVEAEEEGDFAEYVDRVVHGHRLMFDPGGMHARWATIDGKPAIVE